MTTPRIITLTLTGASHLVGYSSFSAQEVRRVRWDRPGHRVLVGPFTGQPEMNEPKQIQLKPITRAVYVRARALDPSHDLHLPLIHAPGQLLCIPLIAPPPAAPDLLARLARLFASVPWIFAHTYAGGDAEHFYSRREVWPSEKVFIAAVTALQRHGYRAKFRGGWWQQLDVDGFTYWGGFERPEQHRWLNRRALTRPAVPIVVQQTLVIEDAELLPLPAADDLWRALALELFGAPGEGLP